MSDKIEGMQHPRVKFELNKELDVDIASQFINLSTSGVDFGAGIVKLHPELQDSKSKTASEQKVDIKDYVDKYYLENSDNIKKVLKNVQDEWLEAQELFFSSVNRLFQGHSWPDGRYICYLSIFDCNPRFLEDKTFQVYFRHNQGTNHVIAHEMLHFIFYDYFEKKESKFYKSLDENKIWQLSEVFDDLVLALPSFDAFKPKDESHYPEIADLFDKLNKSLVDKFSLDDFFKEAKKVL